MASEYTIKEALSELNISKATLYYRINKLKRKMEPHILIRHGKKFISSKGIEILRVNEGLDKLSYSLGGSSESSGSASDSSDREKQVSNDAFNVLKIENEFLKSQIQEKDNQIQTLSRLVENSQLLLKHEQDKNTILIDREKTKKKRFWRIFTKQ